MPEEPKGTIFMSDLSTPSMRKGDDGEEKIGERKKDSNDAYSGH